MKKGLLGSTALISAVAMISGTASAAEAPTWKLTGNANFQFYWVDQDASGTGAATWDDGDETWAVGTKVGTSSTGSQKLLWPLGMYETGAAGVQEHDWYFGVDEAELQLNVSGTADNGLNYGFKIEINANTTDNTVVDEARLQLSGGWGTLQMGDEDGAEDIMNYGGENLMGATGGFDGDQDDYLYRAGGGVISASHASWTSTDGTKFFQIELVGDDASMNLAAPSYASIAGDTSDQTKVSYFSPRFSGFQVGASITPTPNNGDNFKEDGDWENHIGLGANYDNSFGDLRIRASAVYSTRSNVAQGNGPDGITDLYEGVSAFSVGGIVGWGPFSLGANYTDNGDSGQPIVQDWVAGAYATAPIETSYWNVAAGFETGPMYFSVGYFASTLEFGPFDDSTYEHLALTADYTVAPGLSAYAEINMISDELLGGGISDVWIEGDPEPIAGPGYSLSSSNDTTSLVLGMNISF
ncbi:MAG: porin [Proteobacteria bacterium]|nr:porin [Pseudomonadota bacterium]